MENIISFVVPTYAIVDFTVVLLGRTNERGRLHRLLTPLAN